MTTKKTATVANTTLRTLKCSCIESDYYQTTIKYCAAHKKYFSTHGNMRVDLAKAK